MLNKLANKYIKNTYGTDIFVGIIKEANIRNLLKQGWQKISDTVSVGAKAIKDHPVQSTILGAEIAGGITVPLVTVNMVENAIDEKKKEVEEQAEDSLWGVAGGGLVGAGMGLGLGAALTANGTTKAKILGMLLGTAVGGTAGALGGYYIGKDKNTNDTNANT